MRFHGHTELQPSECELGADPLDATAAAELVRRATRGARAMASAALLLAAVASCGTAFVLYRVHVASFAQANTMNGVILEDAEMRFDEAYGEKMQIPGYHRVLLNTVVRRGRDVASEQVRFLEVGDTVYVTEKKGRRVRIISPTRGWMSLETTDGVRILRPDLALKGVKYSRNASAMAQVFQSKAARDAAEKAMRSAAEFTKLEDTLVDALKNINKGFLQKPGETLAHALKSQQAKEAGQIVKQGAMQLSKQAAQAFVVQKRGVEHMLKARLTSEQQDRLGKDGDKLLSEVKEALERHKEA